MLVALAACYETPTTDVSFRCGPEGQCPDGYECRDDGCCHLLNSSGGVCPASDASPQPPLPVDAAIDAQPADADPADAAPDAQPADAGTSGAQ